MCKNCDFHCFTVATQRSLGRSSVLRRDLGRSSVYGGFSRFTEDLRTLRTHYIRTNFRITAPFHCLAPSIFLLRPLVNHLTKLLVVKLIIATGIKLIESNLDLFISQVLTNAQELLEYIHVVFLIRSNYILSPYLNIITVNVTLNSTVLFPVKTVSSAGTIKSLPSKGHKTAESFCYTFI